jgi:hypothetical protein
VDFLVGKGAQVEAQAASGVTALWLAAGDGHKAVVKYLLGRIYKYIFVYMCIYKFVCVHMCT